MRARKAYTHASIFYEHVPERRNKEEDEERLEVVLLGRRTYMSMGVLRPCCFFQRRAGVVGGWARKKKRETNGG